MEAWWTHNYVYFLNKPTFYFKHNMKGLDTFIMICILWLLLAIAVFRLFVIIIDLCDCCV